MTTEGQFEGSTAVLDRPKVDIAEIVGALPAQACECLFEDCELHEDRCDREAKWAVRTHAFENVEDENHYLTFNLCDDCLESIRDLAVSVVGSPPCLCGLAAKCVDDVVGPIVELP
ncbi:hypothetical protein BKG86_01945 [Mycobacteroides chelonae]|uniref:hypothetical protein n=1 Tax=Mycobacteroides chelonae TaxID=1774 RepID=UPI0008AA0D06|nr:hypothetical protein [Mycobacteroides chelonae]OHU68838.1 hypothetical protein BKG86_01945 [Mycobacteroides chelonae]